MRHQLAIFTLVAQGESLLHTEAMLFVDDHQPEPRKRHSFLHQGMRADHHRRVGGNPLQRQLACLAGHLAGQPCHLDAERPQPMPEIVQMLLGEQLGRRHQGHLMTRFHRGQRS